MGKSRRPRIQPTKVVVSGAVGGPSTGHGMNYQNLYAVLRALDLIDRCLAAPYRAFTISIEPRTALDGKPTAWDICTQPDDSFYEVKLNPTRSDVLDWIERSSTASGANPTRIFSLVYSAASGPILASVQQLMRIAVEAAGDNDRFSRLIELEEARDDGEICGRTNAPPHELLTRIRLVQEPESGLDSEIDFRARRISGERGGKRLREFLFQKFVEAVPHRKTFNIGEIIDELRKEGVEFQPPPEVAASDLSSSGCWNTLLYCKAAHREYRPMFSLKHFRRQSRISRSSYSPCGTRASCPSMMACGRCDRCRVRSHFMTGRIFGEDCWRLCLRTSMPTEMKRQDGSKSSTPSKLREGVLHTANRRLRRCSEFLTNCLSVEETNILFSKWLICRLGQHDGPDSSAVRK